MLSKIMYVNYKSSFEMVGLSKMMWGSMVCRLFNYHVKFPKPITEKKKPLLLRLKPNVMDIRITVIVDLLLAFEAPFKCIPG
jgi:hypothetical protein